MYHPYYKIIYAATLASMVFISSGVQAQERSPAAVALSEGTKEFLSDPARTGSLVGSILAGAAVANPLAPILGSVAGFMIGKSSAFSDKNSNAARRHAYNNRTLAPDEGVPVASLSGLTGKPLSASEPTILAASPVSSATPSFVAPVNELETGNQLDQAEPIVIVPSPGQAEARRLSERSEQILMVELPEEMDLDNPAEPPVQPVALGLMDSTRVGNSLQKQLAEECRNTRPSQPLSPRCYYMAQ